MNKVSSSSDSAQSSVNAVTVVDPIDRWLALGIRGGIIGVGVLGLGLYVKNSRLFARYQHVSRIPPEFFSKEVELKGVVKEISPRGVLKIEHQPIIMLPRLLTRKSPKNVSLLNLRLAGLDISGAGLTYLSKDLRIENKPVTFSVLKISENNTDVADANLSVKKSFLSRVNLNIDLIRRGYARVFAPADIQHLNALQTNAAYSRLITRLLMCEKVADRRGVGMWERSSVVESIRSVPSTLSQIVKSSTSAKLLVLFFEMFRDLFMLCRELLRQAYYLAVVLSGYSRNAYRSIGNGVDNISYFYYNLQKKIKARVLINSNKKDDRKPM